MSTRKLQAITIIHKLMTCLSENRVGLRSAVSWQHCGVVTTARQACSWLNKQNNT